MEFHELANIFPLMSGLEFEELKASLKRNGFDRKTPVLLYEGKILDGRNRWRACQELGIEPEIEEFNGPEDPVEFILRHNLARRHLTESQRALAASRFAVLRQGRNGGPNVDKSTFKTQTELAQRFSVGRATVIAARKVDEQASAQLVKAVEDGVIAVTVAEKLVVLSAREQSEIVLEKDEKKRRQKIRDAKVKAKERHDKENEHRQDLRAFALAPTIKISGINLGPFSLKAWEKLTANEKDRVIATGFENDRATLNEQTGDAIEWARFSHNVVTGCKHDCPYCYARDIAQSQKMAQLYPFKFEPTFHPARLAGPSRVKVPTEARSDLSYRNIFANSMSDLFGQWVPSEWIEATIEMARRNPKWNFLTLTKFPIRAAEFEFPENWWLGTTVDAQIRVDNAEKAFAKIRCKTNWLSCEPILTPLSFKRLDLFQWVVMGGASASEKTPEWIPPFDWIVDLQRQARKAGCRIYHKTNLGLMNALRIKEFPWQAPREKALPKAFRYLKGMD